ncbi:MAG TPA: hypothetical protein VK815_16070 [Candidatus Acidoferrales bacterium]|jgi:hypothetical protein|nr:hypothetical protein [Candidatus Acidoferrales bacterium]
MHPAAIQLTKTIHTEFLRDKGYRLAASKLRYEFLGGRVISRLRGCNKWNRDTMLPWAFQIDSKIVFDDLDYDPQRSPPKPGPRGKISGGLYEISKGGDRDLAKKLAGVICRLTDEFIGKRDIFYAHFKHLLEERRNGNEGQWVHTPRKLGALEKAEVEQWLAKQSRKASRK